ncbi:MAG TPA: LD-carboxypeptidase [Chitinophagaceae bacterium]|nr:LD-carboxypeptidase [Chitinophagaceae bacterium]
MKRKDFLSSASSLLAAATLPRFTERIINSSGKDKDEENILPLIPPYLKKGDCIGITSPAGYITFDEIQPSIKLIESWGYKVRIGETIGKRDFTFGGTDEERAKDLQQMLDDKSVKAIMCARGGYGAVRIIDKLKWEKFKIRPKWIIGFSDVTVIHSHINKNLGIASIHSKMCNSFPDDWTKAEPVQIDTINSIQKALSGEKMKYDIDYNARNKPGITMGVLVGGNLKTLESLAASGSDINTAGKILFVEDTGEYMYSIDRMFWNLKRSGKLSQLKGLIVGGFKIKVDTDGDEFGKTLEEVVLEKVKRYDYPVCFDFPVGHQKNNFALKCGVKHKLIVQQHQCTLTEML